ncbi:MAG: pyruvate dehydrogenase (acetyl-transferring) E1 component subunit alpha [Ardenticatenaceae bacterium]
MPYPLAEDVVQVLTKDGQVVGELPDLSAKELVGFYRWMVFGRVFSDRMVALQRQGRMGTFAPLRGQEASAAIAGPLEQEDWLTGSYRDILPYFVKGVPPLAIMENYRGYAGAKYPYEARCLPMQIVLATQMLHAVGLAMAIKYDGKPNVAVGVCGDGATSEGDFNESLNFAAVFKAPAVIVVQNNGWAISVPRHKQTVTEYIAHRGPGFGMPGYVVDGNDLLAVYKVMSDCVARARVGDGPSLVEMLTYRLSSHTTADDPTKYRSQSEVNEWRQRDPIIRYRKFLMDRNMLSDLEDEQLHEEITEEIQGTVERLEAMPPQDPAEIFDLVYAEPTPQLKQQRSELLESLRRE